MNLSTLSDRPLHRAAVALDPASSVKIESHRFEVTSGDRLDLVDLTQKVREIFNGSAVNEGVLYVHSLHTTTALMINEWQDALVVDLEEFLRGLVDDRDYFRHNDPEHSDCVRSNATAHLRKALLSHNVTVPIADGALALGRWQSIIFADLDGPQKRSILAQVIGK